MLVLNQKYCFATTYINAPIVNLKFFFFFFFFKLRNWLAFLEISNKNIHDSNPLTLNYWIKSEGCKKKPNNYHIYKIYVSLIMCGFLIRV